MENIVKFPAQRTGLPQPVLDRAAELGIPVHRAKEIYQKTMDILTGHAPAAPKETPAPTYVPAYCDPDNEFRGEKYEATKSLDIADIAKRVRQDIKDSIKRGTLPKDLKTSVRIDRYSGGQSLNIKITALESVPIYSEFAINNLKTTGQTYDLENRYKEVYSEGLRAILAALKSIQQSYNRDNSDAMTDYFDVNFYGHVDLDFELEVAAKNKIKNGGA